MTSLKPLENLHGLFVIDGIVYNHKGPVRCWLNSNGYKHFWHNKQRLPVHRVVFALGTGRSVFGIIDHKNGDKLDCRFENLRECKNSENIQNSKIYSNNKSGIKGVSWNKNKSKWFVTISVNKNKIFLGLYEDLELAELIINEARDKYHKQFARNA